MHPCAKPLAICSMLMSFLPRSLHHCPYFCFIFCEKRWLKTQLIKKYIFFSGNTKGLVVSLFHDVQGLNVYSILQHDTLVMSIGAIRRIEERLHTPINR